MFCGVGGLAHGLQAAGIDVKLGVDLDPACRVPFESNIRSEFLLEDVQTLSVDVLNSAFGDASVRVLAGCAPCQPFSTLSQSRKSKDDRWRLLEEFAHFAEELRPEIITLENVPRLAQRSVWPRFTDKLNDLGYNLSWDIVDCTKFGVPQSRKRLVLVASLLGVIPLPTGSRKQKSTRATIEKLPTLEAGDFDAADPLHRASKLSELNLQRIRASKPGGTWRDWSKELIAPCHRKETGATYPSVYGRMEWDKPSPTITTQFYAYGSGRFGHPEQDRAITLREGALLQSFPRNYKFLRDDDPVSFKRIGTLIGNAVPPALAKGVGEAISKHVATL